MITKPIVRQWVRASHRYLGLFAGIQFLAWTLGGLYFSWTNIGEIRGEDIRAEKKALPLPEGTGPLAALYDSVQLQMPGHKIRAIQVVDILGKAYFQVQLQDDPEKVKLYDLENLRLRAPLSAEEATEVARLGLKDEAPVISTRYLTAVNGHHEYREKPLPAYAIAFGPPANTTVYVSAHWGTVQSYRSSRWRVFDFLWMLHIMDYKGRDDINNLLLRVFSLIGMVTLGSGYALYFFTSKPKPAKK